VEGCNKRGVSVTELRTESRRGVTAQVRAEVAWKLVEDYGFTLAEVARQIGISTCGVSKLLSWSVST
jgi:putative transposase